MKALSLRQPWCDAVLYGGKRIENRLRWQGSSFRGEFVLHAAKAYTTREWLEAIEFMVKRKLLFPHDHEAMALGALVGTARVVDVIMRGGLQHGGPGCKPSVVKYVEHPRSKDPWYMGGFAFVLEDVEVFKVPVPYRGSLGFFEVPDDVIREARGG
jgi:hypothetical protein